jgi:tRNA threonylcarbamoyl adenosine modification protein YjeE
MIIALLLRLTTHSPDETRALGTVIGRMLQDPVAFLLIGDYGTGKTTFVQGLGIGLNVTEPIRSPSYNILKKYDSGRRPLVHVDLYRTKGQADVDELAIGELLPNGGVLAIEWPPDQGEYNVELPQVSVRFLVPDSALQATDLLPGIPDSAPHDFDEIEERQLEFIVDEMTTPISVIEVLVALADR